MTVLGIQGCGLADKPTPERKGRGERFREGRVRGGRELGGRGREKGGIGSDKWPYHDRIDGALLKNANIHGDSWT